MNEQLTVGTRIRLLRELNDMSQEELAKKMGYKDRSSISRIEKESDKNISLDVIQKFAEVFDCSPLYLMGWDEETFQEKLEKYKDELPNKTYSDKEYEFINKYNQLNDEQKKLIDNMLTALTSKQ